MSTFHNQQFPAPPHEVFGCAQGIQPSNRKHLHGVLVTYNQWVREYKQTHPHRCVYHGKVDGKNPSGKIGGGLFIAWHLIHQPAEEAILVG